MENSIERGYAYNKKEFWEVHPNESEEFENLKHKYGDYYSKTGMVIEDGRRREDIEKRYGELLTMRAKFYDHEHAKLLSGFTSDGVTEVQEARAEQERRSDEKLNWTDNVIPFKKPEAAPKDDGEYRKAG